MRPAHLKSAAELGVNKPHGTRIRYMAGCKCRFCRAANSNYETQRAALRRQGLDNGLVPADRARTHLFMLSKMGVGRRAVVDEAKVSRTIVCMIKKGTRTQIRKETERRILAVTISAAKPHAIIKAGPIWKLLRKLLKEGFTKAALAQRLGSKTPALQISKRRVTVETALKVIRLYRLTV